MPRRERDLPFTSLSIWLLNSMNIFPTSSCPPTVSRSHLSSPPSVPRQYCILRQQRPSESMRAKIFHLCLLGRRVAVGFGRRVDMRQRARTAPTPGLPGGWTDVHPFRLCRLPRAPQVSRRRSRGRTKDSFISQILAILIFGYRAIERGIMDTTLMTRSNGRAGRSVGRVGVGTGRSGAAAGLDKEISITALRVAVTSVVRVSEEF